MNPLTKFLALMLSCIILMSFLLTGMFYYVHASEFPTTTITNSTTSTQTIPPFVKSIANLTTIQTATSTSESSRASSDYGTLSLILVIVLIAVLVIITILRRYYKK